MFFHYQTTTTKPDLEIIAYFITLKSTNNAATSTCYINSWQPRGFGSGVIKKKTHFFNYQRNDSHLAQVLRANIAVTETVERRAALQGTPVYWETCYFLKRPLGTATATWETEVTPGWGIDVQK